MQQNRKEAKRRLGYLPEGAPAYGEMTPRALPPFIAELRGFDGAEVSTPGRRSPSRRPALAPCSTRPIETLSKGYKRRVGIAQAILHDPQVLIMDEPTDGLDPNQKHHVRKLITEMAREKAIIVSTHILEEVEAVCTRAVVINKGRIVADGTAEDLMRREPNHGAVAIRVAADKAEAVKAALAGAAGVDKVETVSQANGQLQLRARSAERRGHRRRASRQRCATSGLAVEEICVERGKLDDVFRQITTSDRS